MHIQLPALIGKHPQLQIVKPMIEAALQAVEPGAAVRRNLRCLDNTLTVADKDYDLDAYSRIFVIGFGKAALGMGDAAAEVLGGHFTGGILITKSLAGKSQYGSLEKFKVLKGNHPVPGKQSIAATQEVLRLVQDRRKGDLFLCLISGGGSALFTQPFEGISLSDLQAMTKLLLECGANINEMNIVRKHIDLVKGGGLCRLMFPAEVAALILSDVIGNPLDAIASGPTAADGHTFAEARGILRKYELEKRAPASVLRTLEAGDLGLIDDTVRSHDPCMMNTENRVIACNYLAAKAACDIAAQNGWNTMLLSTYLQGEACQEGGNLAGIIRQIQSSGEPIKPPACIVIGGETTVTIRCQDGLGGRNLELAMGAVAPLSGLERVALITLATDGEDGPTDAAGAVVLGDTLEKGQTLGLDLKEFLNKNDSYRYFSASGSLIKTGKTGTNVNDLTFLLAW